MFASLILFTASIRHKQLDGERCLTIQNVPNASSLGPSFPLDFLILLLAGPLQLWRA
jgi:hypothetical protein